MKNSLLEQLEHSIKTNWEKPSLTDYKGATYTYKDVARKIEKLHILFENCGIQPGDKIALCSRNIASWGIAFLATVTYGAVAVPILNEFKADNLHHLINHSEAKLLFVGEEVWNRIDEACIPNLEAIFAMEDYELRVSRKNKLSETRKCLNQLFCEKYPNRFSPEDVIYGIEDPDQMAVINYTSGTTSMSKGVMLSYRSLFSNICFSAEVLGEEEGQNIVSMLPMAHMYGLAFEFLYSFSIGTHVYFLTRTPSPKIIADAFAEVRPNLIITVPLVIEKIIRKKVFPTIEKPLVNMLLNIPMINEKIYSNIHDKVMQAFGGRLRGVIVGGAAISHDVEVFLQKIHFPFTTGYGMTECGPILAYAPWEKFVVGSCGFAASRMTLRIDSPDQEHIVGEILAKGDNVMMGYYRNPEATAATIDSDGWMHTGDLGLIDKKGNVFIKGRSKNMILSSNGQNIYPEEIEDQINSLNYITESIVVSDGGKLVALVYPDFEVLNSNGFENNVNQAVEKAVLELNKSLPGYSQISKVKIYNEEFEKTPKRSIKRFMYQS